MDIVAPTSVYLYYDSSDILIYVGITSRGIKRNVEHNTTKDWWRFVARQEVEHFDTRGEALAREKQLIVKHSPPFNTQHNPAVAKVRSAYLLFRAANDQPVKLRDAVRAMEQRLELDPHDLGERENMALRTRLDDALVVAAMQMPDGEQPRVFGLKGKKVRKVASLDRHGPLAVINLSSTTKHPILDAYAIVRFDAQQRLVLRNVHVRLDHSNPRLCAKNCPQPGRTEVRWVRPDSSGRAS